MKQWLICSRKNKLSRLWILNNNNQDCLILGSNIVNNSNNISNNRGKLISKMVIINSSIIIIINNSNNNKILYKIIINNGNSGNSIIIIKFTIISRFLIAIITRLKIVIEAQSVVTITFIIIGLATKAPAVITTATTFFIIVTKILSIAKILSMDSTIPKRTVPIFTISTIIMTTRIISVLIIMRTQILDAKAIFLQIFVHSSRNSRISLEATSRIFECHSFDLSSYFNQQMHSFIEKY